MSQGNRGILGLVLATAFLGILGCGGGGKSTGGGTLPQTSAAPTVSFDGWAPNDASLLQYKAYTFSASGTDPNIGGAITEFQWDFGDGTKATTPAVISGGKATATYNYAYTTGSAATLSVVAKNGAGLLSTAATHAFTITAAPSPLTVAFTTPTSATTINPAINSSYAFAYQVHVTNAGAGTISGSGILLDPGEATATVGTPVDLGGGDWSVGVTYLGSSTVGSRDVTPKVRVVDSNGISSAAVTGPVITVKTVSLTNAAPVVNLTTPTTDNTVAWTSKPFNLGFALSDADNDPVSYTVDWGDGQPVAAPVLPTGNFLAGVPVALTHTYADAFTSTSSGVTITVSASDNRSTVTKTRLVTVKFNALPTATITSPQVSGTAPTGLQAGITPPYVVIPRNGQLNFVGTSTLPGSQDSVTSSWSFPGGAPGTFAGNSPGNVSFSGTQGVITPAIVTFTVTDAFGRTATATKQVLVDGINTQQFNLSFQYRLKSDNNANSSLSPVTLAVNGLGAAVQIFQDGLSNTYNVQDQPQLAGAKAQVSIPVRSDLPFYVEIPNFGSDSTSYLMRIPNAPTGPYADPTLVATAPAGSSSFSFSNAAPWNPTLQIVTAQGFAAESSTAPQRKMNGYTDLVIGQTPVNERWLDRLSVPNTDPTGAIQFIHSNDSVGQLSGIPAYQLFAEWPTLLLARATKDLGETASDPTVTAGNSTNLGFVLDYPKYQGNTQPSETFAAFSMQAFRVPAGVTDPYQLSPAWQSTSAELNSTYPVVLIGGVPTAVDEPHAGLNPVQSSAGINAFLNGLINTSPGVAPLGGGIQNLPLPYDPNDPDRIPLVAPSTRAYSGIKQVFSYSEYLWSTVWARPLVLNSARPNFAYATQYPVPTPLAPLSSFPYFRYSNPTAWPKASGISPDNSAFDLTARGGGVFDGSAPVGLAGAAASAKGVGRFFWTAFTPSYTGDANSGAAIARTWLADDSTSQVPTTFSGSALGDATVAFGFMTPQDTVVDKRGRNADGTLSGATLGGYRVTWFNPTKDASGNPVAPDFWVVELKDASGTKHFMLPGSYPTGSQSLTDLIMTDARTYLPSGNAASAGPATTSGTVTDKVGPGYCWFDIPVELRPTGGAALTVFAVKSILKNNPVSAKRPLNRPDWIDAVKTATATMKMIPSMSGTDLTYAYKIPFNYDWDIVVANGPQTPVAP